MRYDKTWIGWVGDIKAPKALQIWAHSDHSTRHTDKPKSDVNIGAMQQTNPRMTTIQQIPRPGF